MPFFYYPIETIWVSIRQFVFARPTTITMGGFRQHLSKSHDHRPTPDQSHPNWTIMYNVAAAASQTIPRVKIATAGPTTRWRRERNTSSSRFVHIRRRSKPAVRFSPAKTKEETHLNQNRRLVLPFFAEICNLEQRVLWSSLLAMEHAVVAYKQTAKNFNKRLLLMAISKIICFLPIGQPLKEFRCSTSVTVVKNKGNILVGFWNFSLMICTERTGSTVQST